MSFVCIVKQPVKASNNNNNNNKGKIIYFGDWRRVPIAEDSSVLVEQKIMRMSVNICV